MDGKKIENQVLADRSGTPPGIFEGFAEVPSAEGQPFFFQKNYVYKYKAFCKLLSFYQMMLLTNSIPKVMPWENKILSTK